MGRKEDEPLRDAFAQQALIGVMVSRAVLVAADRLEPERASESNIAEQAYRLADAMLAARKR